MTLLIHVVTVMLLPFTLLFYPSPFFTFSIQIKEALLTIRAPFRYLISCMA